MLLRRARAFFAVSLTFGLLQLVSLAVASAGDVRTDGPRSSWMPLLQKTPAATHGMRVGLTETDDHHTAPTPFTPSALYRFGVPSRVSLPPASSAPSLDASVPAGQQRARAPPVSP